MLDPKPAELRVEIRTLAGLPHSYFHSLAPDADGNMYVAGTIYSTATYDFGGGITATGTGIRGENPSLVKYSPSGASQWAQTFFTSSSSHPVDAWAADALGKVYAAGWISGTAAINFGGDVTIGGTFGGFHDADHGDWVPAIPEWNNGFIVKYNASGMTQWFRAITSAVVEALWNVYAFGTFRGNGTCDFGDGVLATGISKGNNVVLVKYNSKGIASWASTDLPLQAVTVDANGNPYAAGSISNTGELDLGGGVTIAGSKYSRAVLVKYDPSGVAPWARIVTASPD
ncbi:MAG: hypothetical protein NTU88_12335 [Armatimonadetes bacterium]|nr:hypothetical protein [Armatimonadota bacterium]